MTRRRPTPIRGRTPHTPNAPPAPPAPGVEAPALRPEAVRAAAMLPALLPLLRASAAVMGDGSAYGPEALGGALVVGPLEHVVALLVADDPAAYAEGVRREPGATVETSGGTLAVLRSSVASLRWRLEDKRRADALEALDAARAADAPGALVFVELGGGAWHLLRLPVEGGDEVPVDDRDEGPVEDLVDAPPVEAARPPVPSPAARAADALGAELGELLPLLEPLLLAALATIAPGEVLVAGRDGASRLPATRLAYGVRLTRQVPGAGVVAVVRVPLAAALEALRASGLEATAGEVAAAARGGERVAVFDLGAGVTWRPVAAPPPPLPPVRVELSGEAARAWLRSLALLGAGGPLAPEARELRDALERAAGGGR